MQAIQEHILDVTLYEPRQKHPAIFEKFDSLLGGESLVLHNDHDPKPLYYQLLGERGDIFSWEYLEQGPAWWKVRITKRREEEEAETIGAIGAKDLRKAEVFKKYDIDFCCGGKRTVREVCAEKGMDATKVEQELQQTNQTITGRPIAYNDWSLDFLSDYIVNNHHSYVRKNLPDIRSYALKVAQVHGSHHPELLPIQQLVEKINKELTEHMEEEEKVLFPYVKQIVQAKNSHQPLAIITGNTLDKLVGDMEKEHDFVGKCFDEIHLLSKDFTLPGDACASYTLLFKMLHEFEEDLHLHIHLENNILFPKAIALQKELAA